jgi:hypothetical protein
VGAWSSGGGGGFGRQDIRRSETVRGRAGMPSTARSESRRGGDHQASKRGVIGEGEHDRWCHLLWKSACFSMCPGSAYWCHLSAKSFAISTNGTIRSESRSGRYQPLLGATPDHSTLRCAGRRRPTASPLHTAAALGRLGQSSRQIALPRRFLWTCAHVQTTRASSARNMLQKWL